MTDWKMVFNKDNYLYSSCYCEENVYQLGKQLLFDREEAMTEKGDQLFVIFISNLNQQTLIWSQRQSPDPKEPVCWDYHVVLCCRNDNLREEDNLIFDFDSTMPFPVPLSRYIQEAFRPNIQIQARFRQ